MRFCYGHRRFTLYPQSVDSWNLNSDNYTGDFLKRTKALGFDALEVGVEVLSQLGTEQKVKDFSSKLNDAGLAVGCVRAGGTLHDAHTDRKIEKNLLARSNTRDGRELKV